MTIQVQNIPNRCLETCRLLAKKKIIVLDNLFNEKGEWSQDQLSKKINLYREQIRKCELQIERRLKEEENRIQAMVSEWHNMIIGSGPEDLLGNEELSNKLEETEHKLKQTVMELQFEKNKKIKEIEKYKDLEREFGKAKNRIEVSILHF